jgi:hypothetical protein
MRKIQKATPGKRRLRKMKTNHLSLASMNGATPDLRARYDKPAEPAAA